MRIDILSAVPGLLEGPFSDSIVKRAQEKGLVEIVVHNIRDWSTDKHNKIDDEPFGGSAGMVLKIQPIADAIESLQSERHYAEVVFLTPDGEQLRQAAVNHLSMQGNLILLCGHYKGIDQRIREHLVTREISIGDYVLSGGEQSALTDSFQDNLLAPPVYTRPAVYNGWEVPEILRSGDHKAITNWLEEQAIERTQALRPDLFEKDS
jgi:tRNA (guanine37-N1)-methyltransferase